MPPSKANKANKGTAKQPKASKAKAPAAKSKSAGSKRRLKETEEERAGEQEEEVEEVEAPSKTKKQRVASSKAKQQSQAEEEVEKKDEEMTDEKHPEEAEEKSVRELEKGDLFFFFRPKIDCQHVHSLSDVAQLYLLISPESAHHRPIKEEDLEDESKLLQGVSAEGADHGRHRLLVFPAKQMPSAASSSSSSSSSSSAAAPRARCWSFVSVASKDLREVEAVLGRSSYQTKTRGERTTQACRLFAEARYELVVHNKAHTVLAYKMVVPACLTSVQQLFHLQSEGQFLLQVKNPEVQAPTQQAKERSARFASLGKNSAHFPSHLQAMFKGKRVSRLRFASLTTVEFLDIKSTEVIWTLVHEHLKDEFSTVAQELECDVQIENELIAHCLDEDEHAFKKLGLEKGGMIGDALHALE